MANGNDRSAELAASVADAFSAGRPLRPVGGDTKRRLGRAVDAEPLTLAGHTGIVEYEPTELVVTVRSGTPLAELETALAERGQMLGFEPPHLGAGATVGGTVACGLSGPRRPYAGAARDFVLGVRILNGRGQPMRFGGQVIKNVAGYDLSRLMAGAQGTLGVLLEVSLRVLPRPSCEVTLVHELDAAAALEAVNRWAGQPLPVSAASHDGERLRLRLSGTEAGVDAARAELGGESDTDGADWWTDLRERRLEHFAGDGPCWRLAVAPAAPLPDLPGRWLLDWGGAQRWLRSDMPAEAVRAAATAGGGHATRIDDPDADDGPFQPLPDAVLGVHRRLKAALDPAAILNPGRLYAGF
jgi:glycolate oxidase FAD binding subunit